MSLLQPSEKVSALKDTNTYYSTVALTKTLYEGEKTQVVSTNEVVTQVVITESVPPKATSVMTSYIALDFEDPSPVINYTTTDVVKTYFVTYTYYNTLMENGKKIVKTNVSTSSDVVTEKLFLHPKRTTSTTKDDKKKQKFDTSGENFHIVATKTYHTTFTYFTTLLQEGNTASPTVISSHSKIVENVITETIDPSLLDKKHLSAIKNQIRDGTDSFTKSATLNNGQKLEVTVIADEISPTKVLPIQKTKMPEKDSSKKVEVESSTPSVIVGSTIIFLDDEPPVKTATPSLTSSKVVKKTKTVTSTSKLRRTTKTKAANPTKVVDPKPLTKIVKPPNQVPDLLGLGSININSLQALTPVLNAMAGLIQTNLKSNRRNDSVVVSTTPKTTPKTTTEENLQNRSPIYIPVGGLSDEFEVAESQNIATFHLQDSEWNGHKDFKPTHESPLLNGGIPISPGDVITANSDVIVGKPGRILPRVPSIPLNQVKDDGYGMKPPPVPQKWPKRNHEYKHIPVQDKPVIHAPSKDDYVGPPPPPREKHKHIPLSRPQDQVYANSQNNYGVSYGVNEVTHEIKIPNIQEEILKQASKETFPIYAGSHNNPIRDYNLEPSIVLPEIVERSTGQPLLVNIQPSQVAFVNIPHNRTTALIYGGSTEPHRNGQYFDDPSPYPQPEFSGIEYNNRVPEIASVYHDGSSNQKQVVGVIKVAPQPIEKDQIQFNINPSRPNLIPYQQNQEVNINVPPISFGMIQQDNEFNAHIINHGETQFRPPPIAYEVVKDRFEGVDEPQLVVAGVGSVGQPEPAFFDKNRRKPLTTENEVSRPKPFIKKPEPNDEIIDLRPPSDVSKPLESHVKFKPQLVGKPFTKVQTPPKRHFGRPEISEFMTPPPYRPKPRPQKPRPIPLHDNLDDDDDDEDLTNEEGEVIQESNSRPLRPGQVPFEILKIKTTTTPKPSRNDTVSFNKPVVNFPRPFGEIPLVRPENQQTNQINNFDQDTYNYIPTRPDSGFITYIGSITARPIHIDIKSTTERPRRRSTTTLRPLTTRRLIPQYHNTSHGFGLKTRKPIPVFIQTTTSKPFGSRPKVTSLPIDRPTRIPEIITPIRTQTEKPFKTSKPLSITDLLNREKVTTVSTTTVKEIVTPELNTGEVPMSSMVDESKMEIMKPPPPVPDINMQPPKIEVNSPSGNIHRVPSLEIHPDLEVHASTGMPYVPKPAEDIIPPPPVSVSDEVVGMNPPPLVSTHKPLIVTESTTQRRTESTRRRPTVKVTTRRPPRPFYEIYNRNKTSTSTIAPTPSSTPTLEVIIGNPTISSSEIELRESESTSTTKLVTSPSTISTTSTSTSSTTQIKSSSSSTTTRDIIPTGVHHAGNEVRVIDDTTSSVTKKPVLATSKTVLPTRYITHTKTSTVTITKTTIVKTLGGPPSTSTILVTKTEKSTLVDTVTEFHTLVKPTSIIETVTTTISTGTSLYPSDVYGSTYPSIKLRPTSSTTASTIVIPTITVENDDSSEDLDEFIISETDPPVVPDGDDSSSENESIFVVMTDKNKGSVIKVPNSSYETQDRDEMLNSNEANNVLLGGIFIASPPSLEVPRVPTDKCEPECKASRNELCQKVEGIMRCVCRPGFARMFPDRPCNRKYSLNLR